MNAAVYVSRRRRVREGRGLLHFVALGLGGVSRPDVYVFIVWDWCGVASGDTGFGVVLYKRALIVEGISAFLLSSKDVVWR